MSATQETYDFVVVGSGFGGSVSAMRLTEKGYRVLVLERGKRFTDPDFPKSNWNLRRFLWFPPLRLFGVLEMSLMKDIFVLHGSGVGGGSLMYANVLMEPSDVLFEAHGWRDLADWKSVLRPHYDTAKRMLGVAPNPRQWPADQHLREIAVELGYGDSVRPTNIGAFFNENAPGETVPDPYFDGEGPERAGCIHCGGCMTGCRHNAKNSLTKNYLYFAEKWGAEVRAESEVVDIRPLPEGQADGARYELMYQKVTGWFRKPKYTVRAKNVVVSAHALGTMKLLFRCKEKGSLPKLSGCLGYNVRTNSEALTGVTSHTLKNDYSKGIAITSFAQVDPVTFVEPVRYSKGSSFMRLLAAPLIGGGKTFWSRLVKLLWYIIRHPGQLLRTHVLPGWSERSTILLIMQTEDNMLRVRPGRSFLTGFRRGVVTENDAEKPLMVDVEIAHKITRKFGEKANAIPQTVLHETLFGIPSTAHFLGGCPMGRTDQDGVVDKYCQVHNYPGLFVVDGSIMPANPGVNPSLTITALAEYAMSHIPAKDGAPLRNVPERAAAAIAK